MKTPYLKSSQNEYGEWQAFFAFQVSHLVYADWLKMKWGFNTGVLLEEALDRGKLFIEAQAFNETEHYIEMAFEQSLALRVINFPEEGVQTALIGKISAPVEREEEIRRAGRNYAREIQATFPCDFILKPAEQKEKFDELFGSDLLSKNLNVAQIQRGNAYHQNATYIPALWQASARSNEQIWRSISEMPKKTLLNITIKPSFFSAKKFYLEEKGETDNNLLEKIIEKRLIARKKYFLLQVHLATNDVLDKNLLRTIGTSLTRDSSNTLLPSYRVRRNIPPEWYKKILEMDLLNISNHLEDLADIEETNAVFRLPHPPESGLPNVNFIDAIRGDVNNTGKDEDEGTRVI